MCGIFLAIPKDNSKLNLQSCKIPLKYLKKRGPHRHFQKLEKRKFFGQTILSMTGSNNKNEELHVSNDKRFLILFNGEIYNYKRLAKKYNLKFKKSFSDTNVLVNSFSPDKIIKFFSELDGMFSIIIYDRFKDKIYISRDIQGEKTLHVFENEKLILISSEINSIKLFLKESKINYYWLQTYFNSRHFIQLENTIYNKIKIVEPGEILEINNNKILKIGQLKIHDMISEDIFNKNTKKNVSELTEELDEIFKKNIKEMIPINRSYCSILSGGVDSSLVSHYLSKICNPKKYLTINHVNKDKISNNIHLFKPFFGKKIQQLKISESDYYKYLQKCLKICSSPINSHDFPGKLFLAKQAKALKTKAIFGGDGADELFGGYETYRQKVSNYFSNNSDYTKYIDWGIKFSNSKNIFKNKLQNNWKRCLESYHFIRNKEEKNRLSMMLNDSSIQLSSVGLRGCDLMFMNYSVESRSLFLRKDIIKFALNLPLKFKIDLNRRNSIGTKILLKRLFIKYFSKELLFPKQGFAGFPNETKKKLGKFKKFKILKILKKNKKKINIEGLSKRNKELEWKILNTEQFLRINENKKK